MNKLMLYIHIPFCEKKCNYCDFVSFHASYDIIDNYIKILLKEIEAKKYMANDYEISSIYFGGGTPSYINAKHICFIMESIRKSYKISDDCEISLELNPHSAIEEKLRIYDEIGINRLSFGLQSTDDHELKLLGRLHTYNDFLKSYNDALHVGFKNINVDLINGIPDQTPETYKKTLKQVLLLHLNHISIYNLIIEQHTLFYELYNNNKLNLPLENDMEKIDSITEELTSYYHLNRYEISNYAKSGFECKHNLGYWSNIPYLGFGLNSSSYFENKRYKNKTKLSDYLNLNYDMYMLDIDKLKYYDEFQILSKTELMNEYVMLGLRKTSGINELDFQKNFALSFYETYKAKLQKYIDNNLLIMDNYTFYLSKRGLDLQNTILSDILL